MNRGGPIQRKTPIESKTPLRRTALNAGPLQRSTLHAESAARANGPKRTQARPSQIPAKVRKALNERSEGRCEIVQQGCTWWATEASHRLRVGMGGRKRQAAVAHHVLSQLLHACHHCHASHLHAEPSRAYAAGWMLREGSNSLTTPVLYRGAWMVLDDSGAVTPINHSLEEAS